MPGSGGGVAFRPAGPLPAAAHCPLVRNDAWQMGNRASVREELAVVVKEHDSVAEQAPALLRTGGYHAGGMAVRCRRGRARREMLTCSESSGGCTGRQSLWAG